MGTDRFFEMSVFVHVAQSGSFSVAARALSLSPSTVSKLIGRLEQRLGVSLFHRSSRVVRPTEEGRRYFDSAVQLLEDLDQAESGLNAQRNSPSGVLRIGAHSTVVIAIIAPLLPRFIQLHPDVKVDISAWGWPNKSELNTETLEANLDIVLMPGKLRDSTMIARKIGVTRRIVCAAPAYLAEHGTPTTLDALLDHNCLFPPIYERFWPLVENGKTRRLRVRGNVASNYFSLLHHIALAGMGVVRLPDFFIRDDIASGRLVPILMDNNSASEPINALYPSSRGQIPRVKAFLDFIGDNAPAVLGLAGSKALDP